METENKKVAVYARVSTDKQKVDMQIHELREFVKRRSWTVMAEYIDEGFTGSDTKRPAFNDMMSEARKRNFDIL